jgi:predicted transcriptional regulator
MSTTTLRIDATLRERIARLAGSLNQTPHNFMVEALAQKADEAEWKLSIQREAQQRDTALLTGGPTVEWHEMRAHLRARLAEAAHKPKAKTKPKSKTARQ